MLDTGDTAKLEVLPAQAARAEIAALDRGDFKQHLCTLRKARRGHSPRSWPVEAVGKPLPGAVADVALAPIVVRDLPVETQRRTVVRSQVARSRCSVNSSQRSARTVCGSQKDTFISVLAKSEARWQIA